MKIKRVKITSKNQEALHQARKGLKFFHKRMKKIGTRKEIKRWKKVKRQLIALQEELAMDYDSPEDAEVTTWMLFEKAVLNKKPGFLTDLVGPWMNKWSLMNSPRILEALMMSFDIGRGFSKKEAYRFHQDWLNEDPDNRLYGIYYFSPDGEVIRIDMITDYLLEMH